MHSAFLERFKERFRQWVVVNARGPYATPFLAIFSFAESVFFPVPVDVVLIPLVIIRAKSWLYYTVVSSVASVLGGVAGYAIGLFFSFIGTGIVAFYGLESELALVSSWLSANVFWATFISAFTPIPYKVFTLSAGFLGAPFFMFIVASALGRTLRYTFVSLLAHFWGASLARVVLRNFTIATFLLTFVVILAYALFVMISG